MTHKKIIHPYDLQMLTGDISLSCDEFIYATLGNGSHEGIQLVKELQGKEKEIKAECRKIHESLQKIEKIISNI